MDGSQSARTRAASHLAVVAAFGATGLVAGVTVKPLYDYAWSHPMVMLTGELLLLGVFAASLRYRALRWPAECAFWVFAGMTAGPLVYRAADELHGLATASAVLGGALVLSVLAVRRLPGSTADAGGPGEDDATTPQVDC